jgi:type IV secretion system protein VirD4
MKIIANFIVAVMFFFATIYFWFKAVGYMGFEPFVDLWARFSGNGNFIPWEIDFQYVIDWINYYWNGWVWSGVFIGFIVSIIFGVLVYKKSRFQKTEKDNLENEKSYNSLLEKGVKKEEGIYSGKLGKKDFFVSYQDRGLVVGPPGTGKTAVLINQILKVADNKTSFIASDIKPEIYSIIHEELEEKGFDVALINPLSSVGHHYNPLDDIVDESEINEMVMNILPLPSRAEPAWVKAQRKYLRLALSYLYHVDGLTCSLPASYAMFAEFDTPSLFLDQIITTDNAMLAASAKKLKAELSSSKPAQSGFSEVFDELNWLHYPDIAETFSDSDFSINDMGKDRPVALFLQFEETKLKTLGALLSLLYGHILNVLIRNTDRQPVALFFDEIGNLPVIDGLAEKLHTIRSRMLPTWMYWQTIAQMDKYSTSGNNGAEIILSSSDLQMFFRSNSEHTQKMVSTLVGTTIDHVTSISEGKRKDVWELLETTKTQNITYSERTAMMIEPHQVGELSKYEAITLYRGGKALGYGSPYFQDYPKYFDKNKG